MAHRGRWHEESQGERCYPCQKCTSPELTIPEPVINFSQNACRDRYESLMNGTAKPTPESIPNPTPEVLARVQSRIDKEARVAKDQHTPADQQANIAGNAWSSRQRHYF